MFYHNGYILLPVFIIAATVVMLSAVMLEQAYLQRSMFFNLQHYSQHKRAAKKQLSVLEEKFIAHLKVYGSEQNFVIPEYATIEKIYFIPDTSETSCNTGVSLFKLIVKNTGYVQNNTMFSTIVFRDS